VIPVPPAEQQSTPAGSARFGPPPAWGTTTTQTALRIAAFWSLLRAPEPVSQRQLAADTDLALPAVMTDLDLLATAGRIKRDESGAVTGSLGLTFTPTRHEIGVNGAQRHVYCALDAVGILAALAADGWIDTTNPATGHRFRLEVTAGVPYHPDPEPVLFIAGRAAVASVIDEWCPLVNFYPDEATASRWAATAGASGGCLGLADAARYGGQLWRPWIGRDDATRFAATL
jgi:hypothetical protein